MPDDAILAVGLHRGELLIDEGAFVARHAVGLDECAATEQPYAERVEISRTDAYHRDLGLVTIRIDWTSLNLKLPQEPAKERRIRGQAARLQRPDAVQPLFDLLIQRRPRIALRVFRQRQCQAHRE